MRYVFKITNQMRLTLTSTNHHETCKDLFNICVGADVSEADAGHAADSEVKGCYIS